MRKIVALLLVAVLSVVRADITFCPNHCKCTVEGSSGSSVVCTKLDPEEQKFMDPVQHLTVVNPANKVFTLSENIFVKMGLQKLESIKIVNASLSDIAVKAFSNLTSLYDVNLSDNQLFLIHADTFATNINLHRLNLSKNPMQLTQLLQSPHESLLRSSSLTDLDLSNCHLSQILPKTFSQLKNLFFISLANNYLKAIPTDTFEGLDYLEELDLSYNNITKVDKNAFKMNKEVSVLKLRGNPIEAFSGFHSTSIEELDLSSCKLSVLMKETTEGMPDLITLNLSNNNIGVISSDALDDLEELKTIDLSYNKLIGPLPQILFQHNQELNSLILSGNKDLGSLVEETGFAGNHMPMSVLELADCSLTSITPGQLKGMSNLNVLNVSNNAISHLHDLTFAQLTQLNTLDLSNNELTSLSGALFANNNLLIKLILTGNRLKHLSTATFVGLTSLKYLYANNCSMEHLWEGHKHADEQRVVKQKMLPALTLLDVSDNLLRFVHVDDFYGMDKLEAIGLDANPLECDKATFLVISYLEKKRVDPHRKDLVHSAGFSHRSSIAAAGDRWTSLVDSICPWTHVKPKELVVSTVAEQRNTSPPSQASVTAEPDAPVASQKDKRPIIERPVSRITKVDEIVVETTTDTSIMWPMALAFSILIVALYFIIYLIGEVTHRRRGIPAAYARAATLGGHVRTRGASGSPLYYKLYEECSIPTPPPANEKKNFILDFSPIPAILKKHTYKVMRNNGEANV